MFIFETETKTKIARQLAECVGKWLMGELKVGELGGWWEQVEVDEWARESLVICSRTLRSLFLA